MLPSPSAAEKELLENIWRDQARPQGPALDFSRQAFPAQWARQGRETSPDELAGSLRARLGWPQWVRLYAKPALAVVAASRLAKARSGAGGVMWMAPGTGSPFQSSGEAPGMAVLRGDWAPHPDTMAAAAESIRERGLLFCLDECVTGFRLAPGGAAEHFALEPDLVLMGNALAAGLPLGVLAGTGDAPPGAGKAPGPEACKAAAGVLARLDRELPGRLYSLGRLLVLGLMAYLGRAQVADQVEWEGPLAMPRLKGRRLWAFIELCKEEGLTLAPLVLPDPDLDPAQAAQDIWPRLARSAARLRVLPEGEMAPLGWRDAAQATSCARVSDILAELD